MTLATCSVTVHRDRTCSKNRNYELHRIPTRAHTFCSCRAPLLTSLVAYLIRGRPGSCINSNGEYFDRVGCVCWWTRARGTKLSNRRDAKTQRAYSKLPDFFCPSTSVDMGFQLKLTCLSAPLRPCLPSHLPCMAGRSAVKNFLCWC
jgi:hypothetical protein